MPKHKSTDDLLKDDLEKQLAKAEEATRAELEAAAASLPEEPLEPAAEAPPEDDRVKKALSKLGVTLEDLEELAEPTVKPEQEEAAKYLALMRREQREAEKLTEEEDRKRYLHYIECRYCRAAGAFFSGNPRGRYIIPHRRYDPKDPLMLGYFQINKPLSMAYAGGDIPCQACGRQLPFMKTPTGLVLNQRFARRMNREQALARGA